MSHSSATGTVEPHARVAESAPPRIGSGIDYERFLDCVHCGLCTAACPTYLETGDENDSPRGRIYLMRAVTDGRLELSGTVQRHLDLCLDCRSCETACPSGVQYGRLIEPFRVEMQAAAAGSARSGAGAAGRPGWFQRLVLYGLFPYPRRMRWALAPARLMQLLRLDRALESFGLTKLLPMKLRRMQMLLPRLGRRPAPLPEVLPAIGPRRARVALFTGCVADAMFGETNWATARVLQANGCEVVVPRGQACCGAIHYHSGSGGPALEFARTNAAAFRPGELDAIIINVAGCGSMLKDYGHVAHELAPGDEQQADELSRFAARVRDVSEFLVELGPKPPTGEIRLKATYHDACHLVHAQRVRSQPRDLLALVPGLELVPLAESDICCGAAGSYNLTEPEMSDRLSRRKLEHILATGADAVITGNAGCSLQIQAALRQAGRDVWVAHPMDVLDLSYRGLKPPGRK
ncbi:MAG TPA: heterodisulfide reductase-related iron-sulfur binding cluster [Planctomycetaceae bacterium]|nr:heterodisulfide reductase-related iron-sulfur binding cluster [Planctomycetaceae bacterium]